MITETNQKLEISLEEYKALIETSTKYDLIKDVLKRENNGYFSSETEKALRFITGVKTEND